MLITKDVALRCICDRNRVQREFIKGGEMMMVASKLGGFETCRSIFRVTVRHVLP
jgi:hypothetical protein